MIEFDKNGHALKTTYVNCYFFSEITGEYTGQAYEQILDGFSLPGRSTLIEPPEVAQGKVAVFKEGKWEQITDLRGRTAYDTATKQESVISYIGELKDGYTLLKPGSGFDVWDGSAWLIDESAKSAADVESAKAEKQYRLREASEKIRLLEDAAEFEMATDEEVESLKAWKRYRVLVNRVDVSKAPDIEWPDTPEE